MVSRQVDAAWVWSYTTTAQKAVYGRFPADTTYTKDYLQLPRASGRLLQSKFPSLSPAASVSLTYEWQPGGSMPGFLNFSSDRYHLSWPTGTGPDPWRLTPRPSAVGPGTFPGDPHATTSDSANAALSNFVASGIEGVLLAVKLVGQSDRLHLRAYVVRAPVDLRFADTSLLPPPVRSLTVGFRANLSCQSADLVAPGTRPVYFDPDVNHDSWSLLAPLATSAPTAASSSARTTGRPALSTSPTGLNEVAGANPDPSSDDAAAESGLYDEAEVASFGQDIQDGKYAVQDATATTKTRGSAQRAFAKAVKTNYGFRCAITGISTREFLVASHIVPWAADESIRVDPSNGICLSTLVDRAFDSGFLAIDDGFIVHINRGKMAGDPELLSALAPYDGTRLSLPAAGMPKPEYLRRRLVGNETVNDPTATQ